jgi:GNAT superfamily N-acetyltransferase
VKPRLEIHTVVGVLPDDLGALEQAASDDGVGIVARLKVDWAGGVVRFDRVGETLVAGWWAGELAGIAGMTRDPYIAAMRMRRVYVAPQFRRHGIGRELAFHVLRRPEIVDQRVTVNAGTPEAPAFCEALGFRPVSGQRHTHERPWEGAR